MPASVRLTPLAAFVLALGGAAGFPALALAGNGGLAPVAPNSPNAERIADMYYFVSIFAVLIFLAVAVPLVLFMVRYRSRGRGREIEGPQIRGNNRLELGWTVLPVLILVVIASFVFYKLEGTSTLEGTATAGAGDLKVTVEARRFYWQYRYPNGAIAVQRLRAPQGRVVDLEITAPDGDVNHSFWVPALGGKFDAIPGETTETSFRADRIGVYEGVCAEFCGLLHTEMPAEIEVIAATEFDSWLATEGSQQEGGTSTLGEQTYRGACAKCHGFEGEGLIGPTLAGNPIVSDTRRVEEIVRNGREEMPPVAEDWSERQLDALTAYLKRAYGPDEDESGS